MEALHSELQPCPHCGETIELLIDTSAGGQEYVEDCQVCCRPIVITVTTTGQGEFLITTAPENG